MVDKQSVLSSAYISKTDGEPQLLSRKYALQAGLYMWWLVENDSEIVQNHYSSVGSFATQKHTLKNNTFFFTILSPMLITITLIHSAVLLAGQYL